MNKVLTFLNAMRGEVVNHPGLDKDDTSAHIVTEIYSQGNCGNLAVMLAIAFNGTPHVVMS